MTKEINENEKPNDEVIVISELNMSFGNNKVLNGINLRVHKGENVIVLGRSGSGKSVLIKLIAGLLKPDSGTITIFGENIAKLNKKQLRNLRMRIGFSFQSSALYDSMNVRENLAFPLIRNNRKLNEKQVNEVIEKVLHDVGLLDKIHQMPAELSGGQKKRIGIARMLMLNPEILLYDEPTGGLDPITCTEINHLINEVQKQYNTTSIIITHDLSCAKSTGDRILMIADGKFLKEGNFKEVFSTDDPLIKAFYGYNFIEEIKRKND